ncbi:MAG: LysR family transcriptional regulator [Chromatiales bacterium]|nr:LysR family transcriptional regulator [Chromatiales bacterium]
MPLYSEQSCAPSVAAPDFLIRHATLRQLQIFEAIVRLGSFTRAAEELFLTQPTVSMQTKRLSDSIGMPLFEQTGRKLRTTEAGAELYQSCCRIFVNLANLESKFAQLKGDCKSRLRIGVISTAKYFVPEVLGKFCRENPSIQVALKMSNRDQILKRLRSNEDDLYVMGQAPQDQPQVEAIPFAPNPLVVMAPRDHYLVGQTRIPLARLAEEPFILREPGSGIRDATLQTFDKRQLRPRIHMELDSNEAIKHAIIGGLGLSVLSLHTLKLEGEKGPLALLDVEDFPIKRNWYLVHPRDRELSAAAQAFMKFTLATGPGLRREMETNWPDLKRHLGNGF